jgi:hypothetical protein
MDKKTLKYCGESSKSHEMRMMHSNKKGYANGGRVKAYPIEAGAGSGEGRMEKISGYGANAKAKK